VKRDITLAFAGDVHFLDRTVGVPLEKVTAMMGAADLAMASGVPAAVTGSAAERVMSVRRKAIACSGLAAAPVR